jgi:hypothetical protein
MRSGRLDEIMMFDVERCRLCDEFDGKGSANSTNLCVALNVIFKWTTKGLNS